MKKKIIWICMDIYGTYESINNKYVSDSKQQKVILFYLMDKIRKNKNCDEIMFSFSSTSDLDDVEKYYKEAEKIIKFCNKRYQTQISLGPQMADNGYYNPFINEKIYDRKEEAKCQKMITFGNMLKNNNIEIEEVIYIDDNPAINVALGVLNKRYQEILLESINLTLVEKGSAGKEILERLGKTDKVDIYSEISSENYEFAKNGLREILEERKLLKTRKNKKTS